MRIEPIYIAEIMFDNLKKGKDIWQDIPLFLDFNADNEAIFMLSASLSPSYDKTYMIEAQKWNALCVEFGVETLSPRLIQSYYETDDIFALEEWLEQNTLLPVMILNRMSGAERQMRGLELETFFIKNEVKPVNVSLETNKILDTNSDIFQRYSDRYQSLQKNDNSLDI